MNPSGKILHYYDDLDKKFHELFAAVSDGFQEEAIHEFRVVMKKQAAFFALLHVIDPAFDAEKTRALYFRIFKNAGSIRKVHIEHNILAGLNLSSERHAGIFENLDQRLAKRIARFRQHDNKKDLRVIVKNGKYIRSRINRIQGDKQIARLDDYFSSIFQNLKSLADDCKKSENHFHDLRKSLKELYYNLALILQLSANYRLPKRALKYLDSLQSNLGEWHDLFLTRKFVGAFDHSTSDKVFRKLDRKIERYVKKINRQLGSFEKMIFALEKRLKKARGRM